MDVYKYQCAVLSKLMVIENQNKVFLSEEGLVMIVKRKNTVQKNSLVTVRR